MCHQIVSEQEEIVSAVVVILLMFCAVIVMVKRVDNEAQAARDSRVSRFGESGELKIARHKCYHARHDTLGARFRTGLARRSLNLRMPNSDF
jgi:hypothetical protein